MMMESKCDRMMCDEDESRDMITHNQCFEHEEKIDSDSLLPSLSN